MDTFAIARLVSAYGVYTSPRLIVDDCPFCGQTHRHGYNGQWGNHFGKRQADCGRGEYLLIDAATVKENK